MHINGHNLCIGCMRPLKYDGRCSFCGLNQEEYYAIPRCLQPGAELADRYVIGKVLGEGSFGITYIGWDRFLDIQVAIKEYFPSDMVSRDVICGLDNNVYLYESKKKKDYDEYLKKFWNEAKCLSRFNKVEGIVSVKDFFYENNTAYLVMQHVDGISVKEYVQANGKMPASQVVKAIRPVLLALEQVHNTGIVHRDISPDNLMLKKDGSLVLIDFGAARMRNIDNTKTMTVMFKRGFSPEEQYRYKGKWGPYTDVYSICATIYYMMTGTAPLDSIIRALGDDLPSLISRKDLDISLRQRKAIMKGMAVTAKNRWQSVGELCDALYEEGVPTTEKKGKSWKKITISAAIFLFVMGFLSIRFLSLQDASPNSIRNPENINIATTDPDVISASAIAHFDQEEPATETVLPIAETEPMVTAPKIIGMRLTAAKRKLKKIGLTYKIKWIESNKKKGIVLKQSVSAGKDVREGTKIILTASRGIKETEPISTSSPVKKNDAEPNPVRKKNTKQNDGFAGIIR